MNTKHTSARQILEQWLDNAMSTSTLGWSPIDGYKGQEGNSEKVAVQDYDNYLNQALAQLLALLEGEVIPVAGLRTEDMEFEQLQAIPLDRLKKLMGNKGDVV